MFPYRTFVAGVTLALFCSLASAYETVTDEFGAPSLPQQTYTIDDLIQDIQDGRLSEYKTALVLDFESGKWTQRERLRKDGKYALLVIGNNVRYSFAVNGRDVAYAKERPVLPLATGSNAGTLGTKLESKLNAVLEAIRAEEVLRVDRVERYAAIMGYTVAEVTSEQTFLNMIRGEFESQSVPSGASTGGAGDFVAIIGKAAIVIAAVRGEHFVSFYTFQPRADDYELEVTRSNQSVETLGIGTGNNVLPSNQAVGTGQSRGGAAGTTTGGATGGDSSGSGSGGATGGGAGTSSGGDSGATTGGASGGTSGSNSGGAASGGIEMPGTDAASQTKPDALNDKVRARFPVSFGLFQSISLSWSLGISASNLRDDKLELREVDADNSRIFSDGEDKEVLRAMTLLHFSVYKNDDFMMGPSLGFVTSSGSDWGTFLGWSFLLGKEERFALSLGVVHGSISRLTGYNIGDVVPNGTDVTSSLTRTAFSIGLTYALPIGKSKQGGVPSSTDDSTEKAAEEAKKAAAGAADGASGGATGGSSGGAGGGG